MHGTAAASRAPRPLPLPPTALDLAELADWQRFMNWGRMMRCLADRAAGGDGGSGAEGAEGAEQLGPAWWSGWEQTLQVGRRWGAGARCDLEWGWWARAPTAYPNCCAAHC